MKLFLAAFLCLSTFTVYAQDARLHESPATPADMALLKPDKPATEITLSDEVEKLKIQAQLLMQENASLRKQLAQVQRQLGDANAQLADLNEQTVQNGGGQLVKQLADKHGVDLNQFEFKIGANDKGEPEMKFVRKEAKK